MPTEQEVTASLYAEAGLKPWQASLSFDEVGDAVFTPTQTEERGALQVLGRRLVDELPRAFVAAQGMKLGQMAGAAAGLPTTGPGGILSAIGGGLAGGTAANMAWDKFGPGEAQRKWLRGSPEQIMRDEAEHPIASRLGGAAGMIGGFKPNMLMPKNLKSLGSGLKSLFTKPSQITKEGAEAVGTVGVNAGLGAGMEGYNQYKQGQGYDVGDMVMAAGLAAPFGKPHAVGLNRPPKPVISMNTTADPAPMPAEPPTVNTERIRNLEVQRETTAENNEARRLATYNRGDHGDPVDTAFQKARAAGIDGDGVADMVHAKLREGQQFQEVFPGAVDEAIAAQAGKFDTTPGQPAGLPRNQPPATQGDQWYRDTAFGQPRPPNWMATTAQQIPTEGTIWNPRRMPGPKPRKLLPYTEPPKTPAADAPPAPVAEPVVEETPAVRQGLPQKPPGAQDQLEQQAQTKQAVPPAVPDEPLADPLAAEHVPMSVVASAAKKSPKTGQAVAAFMQEKPILEGRTFGTTRYMMEQLPREAVNSAIKKRQEAFLFNQPLNLSPEEAQANAVYEHAMIQSADIATTAGYPIKKLPNYVPEMLSIDTARRSQEQGEAFFQKELPLWHRWNQRIHGASFDIADSEIAARNYITRAAKSPNSLGSDFGALTKSAREYHLPPEWMEPDPLRNFQRYGARWAGQVAYRNTIESSPEAMQVLGYDKVPFGTTGEATAHGDSMTTAAENARGAVEDTLFNQGRGTTGASQNLRDLAMAGQQVAYSGAMQTATALKNTFQKIPYHAVHAISTPEGFLKLIQATQRTYIDWHAQKGRTIEAGLVRPGRDPTALVEDSGLTMKTARNMQGVATTLRKVTLGEFFETLNRVHDFTIGEDLAQTHLQNLPKGDADALQFINRFAAGVTKGMSDQEKIFRMARNYAEGVQGSYGPTGLPAPFLKGGLVGVGLRIQRFGWENMMRTGQYVLKPAAAGDFRPLFVYLLGSTLAYPVIQKISEMFSGRPSGLPTAEEVAAGTKPAEIEKVLNLMSAAQTAQIFGSAGSAIGAVGANIRGNPQQLVGDPGISFAVDLIKGLTAGSQALKEGEPVWPVVQEVLKRSILDNMQVARRFSQDPGEAQDVRNKHVFEYLTERKKVTIPEMGTGLMFGNLAGNVREISPTKEAAREGSLEAFQQLDPRERKLVNNYRGGYENPKVEGQYQGWLKTTQGPAKLSEYLARRRTYKERAVPK